MFLILIYLMQQMTIFYDIFPTFSKFESKFLILVMSLKKQPVQSSIFIFLIFPIYMSNKLLFQYSVLIIALS